MSLSTTPRLWAGYEQADVASLEANGLFYRCYVYLAKASWAVEALVTRVQEDGSEEQIFCNEIVSATTIEIGDTNGLPLDSPKVIARGTYFIVHWLQATATVNDLDGAHRNWALFRATMDMTAFDASPTGAWTSQGSVAVWQPSCLYDVAPVLETTTDYVVARHTAGSQVTVGRYTALDWVTSDWVSNFAVTPAPGRVLGVYAHDTDNDVVFTYQNADQAGELWSAHVDADDGNGLLTATTMSEFHSAAAPGEGNLSAWVQVGHVRTAENVVAVVAECLASSNYVLADPTTGHIEQGWVHHVVYRVIDSTTAVRSGNCHWAANLTMMSRPWGYASGTTTVSPSPDVYVVLGYRSIVDTQEWSQAYAFACNLDRAMWNVVDSGASLRPRPISTYWTRGIPDVRTSGWHPEPVESLVTGVHQSGPARRSNHISSASGAPPFGPDVKTRTVAMIAFGTIGTTTDYNTVTTALAASTAPERASVGFFRVFMEDPWTVYRDDSDPEQPVDSFAGPYPRTMHQSVPAGLGLFTGGGTPQMYDGSQVVECGFPWKPEIYAYDTDGTEGDLAPLGTYSWYAVYTWTDAQGQTHRSGPSNVLTATIPVDETIARLFIRCVTISLKDATGFYPLTAPVSIELYRTSNLGTTFFRVFGTNDTQGGDYRPRDTPVNAPEDMIGGIYVSDGLADTRLVLQGNGPYFYVAASATFSEPLPITIPAMAVVTSHQNRVFGASSIDRAVIYYSDEILPFGNDFYQAPVFATGQVYRIGEIGGEITAMQTMNNSLIVFSPSKIYALNCNDAGSGLLGITQELLHESIGCIEPRSVVLTPLGIMFLSSKGYYLLSRSREAGYYSLARSRDEAFSAAGAAVEDDIREGGNIRSATLLENRHQVRLVTNGRPEITQTWTFTLGVAGSTAGAWGILGLSETVSVTEGVAVAVNTIADDIAAAVSALIAAEPPEGTLRWEVQSVSSPTNTVTVRLVGDVDLTLVGFAPGSNTNVATVGLTTSTRPRVLLYDYLVQQWSRAELPQTNAITRLAELVDGCEWRGDGESLHVALAQGAILIERPRDSGALEFADQTAGGNVGIPLDVTLAWLHIAGVSGAQRIWEMVVQTERYNQADVFADLEYDFDGTYTGQAVMPSTYEWPRTGETVTPSDLRIRPREQRARAHRLRIYETSGVTSLETFAIVAMTATVGVESGKRRVSDAQRGEV